MTTIRPALMLDVMHTVQNSLSHRIEARAGKGLEHFKLRGMPLGIGLGCGDDSCGGLRLRVASFRKGLMAVRVKVPRPGSVK